MKPRIKPGSLSTFSLILTGDCNYRCGYCYQDKDALSLDVAAVEKAVDFFFPSFGRDCSILFYGGEPLLRKDTIRAAVHAVKTKNRNAGKKIGFTISTNGSLLDDDTLQYFDRNRFTVLLSFDGRAQEKGRKEGSYSLISATLDKLLDRPRIELLTNSVFTPATVIDLSASIRDIVRRGVRDAQISISTNLPWNRDSFGRLEAELTDLGRFLYAHGKKTGDVPVANFRTLAEPGIFGCQAGVDRMALSPDGRLWGCHLFYDLHKIMKSPYSGRYCLGDLESYIAGRQGPSPGVLDFYADLRMDYFHTPRRFCGLCPDVWDCVICPVDAAFSSGIIGRITADDCRIRNLFRKAKWSLWKDLEKNGIRPRPARGRPSNGGLSA